MNFRGSIARPVLSPVNASAHPLRHAPHDSRSAWFATPSLCDSFIHYAMPVSRRFRLFSVAPGGADTPKRSEEVHISLLRSLRLNSKGMAVMWIPPLRQAQGRDFKKS